MKSSLSALLVAARLSTASAIEVGDSVCITGYIMDNFCIYENNGVLLDNPSVMTLRNPEEHSYHCLLDVDICYNSGFQVLGDKDPDTDLHCPGFRIDDTEAVLSAGRAKGKMGNYPACTFCTNTMNDAPLKGYRATVRGVVSEMGDGSDGVDGVPILTDVEMLDDGEICDNPATPPRCARSGGGTPSPTPAPVEPEPAPVPPPTPPVGPELTCPDTLENSHVIDDKATLFYAIVPDNPAGSNNGILCARLEADNDGWIGFGTSRDGNMIGSEAVLYDPSDDSILKYDLTSKGGIDAMPDEKQTLRDTAIWMRDDGIFGMTFTKLLVEAGEIPIVEDGINIFLHARGGTSIGYHTIRSAFEVDFAAADAPTTSAPTTAEPSIEPTKQPVTTSPTETPSSSPMTQPVTTSPTEYPTSSPSSQPTEMAVPVTTSPTMGSTPLVSVPDTVEPSVQPTKTPTKLPSTSPTTQAPTITPSSSTPSQEPSLTKIGVMPTANPTTKMTDQPTTSPEENFPEGAPTPSDGVVHSSMWWTFGSLASCLYLLF